MLKERERLERLEETREKNSSKMPAVSAARAARRNASQKKKQAQDRRNAMSQMSHRKSLVRGIISVASGEVPRPLHYSLSDRGDYAQGVPGGLD